MFCLNQNGTRLGSKTTLFLDADCYTVGRKVEPKSLVKGIYTEHDKPIYLHENGNRTAR